MTASGLSGKCVLVTGGSRGIGRAIVELFASQGADIVTNSPEEFGRFLQAENAKWKTIADANPDVNANDLTIGSTLKIPPAS